MGSCFSCGHKQSNRSNEAPSRFYSFEEGAAQRRSRPSGSTPPLPSARLTRFFSFEIDKQGNLIETSRSSLPRVPETGERVDDESVLECARTGETYGHRDRIPSRVNMETVDPWFWWSGANLDRPSIAIDMGSNPTIISRPIKVTVVPSVFFASHRDFEVFPEYMDCLSKLRWSGAESVTEASPTQTVASPVSMPEQTRLVIFKLKMSDKVMVSLNEVVDGAAFDQIFNRENRDELLHKKLKLILSPINSPLPIPAKKPRDAETVGSYFGMDNVDFYIDESIGQTKVVSILINIYSKWIIRKFLPIATSAPGRICDFILLSSDDKTVYAHFRLLATKVSQALIKSAT
jgi:hypothetical protein